MKQGNNFIISTNINYDLDEVEYIDFIFVQNDLRKIIKYPSSLAVRKQSTNTIEIYWDYHTTYLFSTKQYIQMDTHIKLTESDTPPQTTISNFRLAPTLFTQYEIVNGMVENPTDEEQPPRIIETWVDILNTYKEQAAESATKAINAANQIEATIANKQNIAWTLKGEWTDPATSYAIDLTDCTQLCIVGNLTCTSLVDLSTNVAVLCTNIGYAGDRTIYYRWETSPFGVDCVTANYTNQLNATQVQSNTDKLISINTINSISAITQLDFTGFTGNITFCDIKIYAR